MLALVCVLLPSAAAYEVYVNIDGIPGESVAKGYEQWIDAYGFTHVVRHDVTATSGTPVERPVFEPIEFTKRLDRATPKLDHACAAGTRIHKVTLAVVVGLQDRPHVLYQIVLEDVYVVRVEIEAKPATGESRPVEKVQLVFGKIRWEYTPPPEGPGGGAPIEEWWDVSENRGS